MVIGQQSFHGYQHHHLGTNTAMNGTDHHDGTKNKRWIYPLFSTVAGTYVIDYIFIMLKSDMVDIKTEE